MPAKKTYYASPERIDKTIVLKQAKRILDLDYARKILNSFPNVVIILNKFRQVIYANDVFMKITGMPNFEDLIGQKPGELVHCIHANSTEYGCGTGVECRYCGAINTVLESIKSNSRTDNEARITTEVDGKIIPLDLHIEATPFEFEESNYTLVVMTDISEVKRREQMERIFIHDLLNSAWSLQSRAELFPKKDLTGDQLELFAKIKDQIDRIMDEVEAQRDIIRMENHELDINVEPVALSAVIESIIQSTKPLNCAKDKELLAESNCSQIKLNTDKRILRRILFNLVKNALEASKKNESVLLISSEVDDSISIQVKNNFVMSEEIKSQVFQRSFSTKGKGRGLGTYSVKILVEEYLQGRVSFESTKENGTIFTVNLRKE